MAAGTHLQPSMLRLSAFAVAYEEMHADCVGQVFKMSGEKTGEAITANA